MFPPQRYGLAVGPYLADGVTLLDDRPRYGGWGNRGVEFCRRCNRYRPTECMGAM